MGGGGSSTAAPIARKVMDAFLLKKYDDEASTEEAGEVEPADIVPTIEGVVE